jgi:hypothetical protein
VAAAWRLAQSDPLAGQIDPIGPGGQELTPAGQGPMPSPVSDYRYSIFARQKAVTCENSTGTTNLPGYAQDLGAQPATASDRVAWQREGTPAWHAWYGNDQLIPARPGPRHLLYKAGQKPGVAGLPADPSGRPGIAVWLGPYSNPGFIEIIDPATGMVLADEFLATAPHGVYARGTLLQYVLWSSGWARQLPQPQGLPGG